MKAVMKPTSSVSQIERQKISVPSRRSKWCQE